jgi:hypothetical protein
MTHVWVRGRVHPHRGSGSRAEDDPRDHRIATHWSHGFLVLARSCLMSFEMPVVLGRIGQAGLAMEVCRGGPCRRDRFRRCACRAFLGSSSGSAISGARYVAWRARLLADLGHARRFVLPIDSVGRRPQSSSTWAARDRRAARPSSMACFRAVFRAEDHREFELLVAPGEGLLEHLNSLVQAAVVDEVSSIPGSSGLT